jgi:hypothetical protein
VKNVDGKNYTVDHNFQTRCAIFFVTQQTIKMSFNRFGMEATHPGPEAANPQQRKIH